MKVVLSLFLILCLWTYCNGQTIYVPNTSWVTNIPANTILIAGSDYSQNYTNSININVTGTNWTISVQKDGLLWDSRLKIFASRLGSGTFIDRFGISVPSLNVSGGIIPIEIPSNSSTVFFNGSFTANNIPIQYEIRGVSVLIPAGNYSTTVYYTISGN